MALPQATEDKFTIRGKSAWEEAQKGITQLPDIETEVQIPDVLYVAIAGNKYFAYVNVNGETIRLTNIEGLD